MRAKYAKKIRRGIVLAKSTTRFLDEALREDSGGDDYLLPHALRFASLNARTAQDGGPLTSHAFQRVTHRWLDKTFYRPFPNLYPSLYPNLPRYSRRQHPRA